MKERTWLPLMVTVLAGCSANGGTADQNDSGACSCLGPDTASDAGAGGDAFTSAADASQPTCGTTMPALYQINSGGPAVAPFVADTDCVGGTSFNVTQAVATGGVANAAPMAVYQDYLWTKTDPMTCTLNNLTPGSTYTLRLHFAEIFDTGPGQREFNVSLNGTPALSNFDVYAEAGSAFKAVVKEFPVVATANGDVAMVVSPIAGFDSAEISGIELYPTSCSASDSGSPNPASDAGSDAGPPTAVRGQQCGAYTKATPTNGGHAYVVDGTNGNDSQDGSAASPFRTVQKAADVAEAGDVVTILAGTYTELVRVQNSGAAGAPIVFQADQCGQTIFTGNTGFYPQVEASPTVNNGACIGSGAGQHDITLSGLDFQGTHDSPGTTSTQVPAVSQVIFMVDNWRLTNVSIDGSDDLEVNVRGTGVIIEQSTFMHGGSHSLVGCGGNTIVRNVLNGNNVTNPASAANCGDSCSVKFLFTNGMLVDNIESYGNNGAGWWFDTDNVNFTIQNSYFHDNHNGFPGIADEISDGPGTIQNNTFFNNDDDIGIWESKGVTIVDNVMNGGSGNPFMFRTMTNRCEDPQGENVPSCMKYYQIANLVVHNNKVKNWTGCLINDPAYSANPAYADPLFTTLNIQMDYDDIWSSSQSPCYLGWEGEPSANSLSALQSALGIEAHGTQTSF